MNNRHRNGVVTDSEPQPEAAPPVTTSELQKAAQWAGFNNVDNITLEAVEHRRFQLWIIAVIILVAIGVAFAIALGPQGSSLPEWITPTIAQVSSLVLVILFGGYALEKELYLRRLTSLLLKERLLTKSLLNRVEEFNILLEAGKSMNLELNLNEVLRTITRCTRDLLHARGTKILLTMGEHDFRTVSEVGESSTSSQFVAELVRVKREGALSRNPDRAEESSCDVMCVPLIHRDEFFGVISVTSEEGRSYSENDLRALSLFGEQAASAVANAKLYEEQRLYAFRSSFQASHDGLTRLPSRNMFLDKLKPLISERKESGTPFAVLFVDMDRFKRINDGLGHSAGDAVLMECGARIRRSIRESDLAARFGGDEFVVLAPEVQTQKDAVELGKRIIDAVATTIQVSSREIRLSCSIGVAMWKEGIDAEGLIGNADIAAQKAKSDVGKVVLYNESMRSRALDEIKLEMSLKQAIDENRLVAYYQPIMTLNGTSDVAGVEALVRWFPPGEGPVPARSFIATAHRTGLLSDIDKWLLDKACSVGTQLYGAANDKTIPIHVNIHPSHLRSPDLIERFEQAIEKHSLTPNQLVIEITEYAVVDNSTYVRNTLSALKRLGVQLALDDFGVGFSSLSYLTRLPIDIVKIDQSFVAGLGDSTQESLLIETILKMADLLQLRVIAEGIETEYQLEALRKLGCVYGQGNYLAPPMPADEIMPHPAAAAG